MAPNATRPRRGTRRIDELERIATDPTSPDTERARAITELAAARRWLPPHLVVMRREAIARLHSGGAGLRPADIARAMGLAPYAGRISQILRAHREASHGTT